MTPIKLTREQSEAQASTLKTIQTLLLTLDVDYLRECYKQMESENSFRDSAMLLDPRPHSALQRGELNKLKTKQLRFYLDAADNLKKIVEVELKVMQANHNTNRLDQMFGL